MNNSTVSRKMIIYTGVKGMDLWDRTLENTVMLQLLDSKKHLVDDQQYDNLHQMVLSSDRSNFELAAEIIPNLKSIKQ